MVCTSVMPVRVRAGPRAGRKRLSMVLPYRAPDNRTSDRGSGGDTGPLILCTSGP